MIRYLYKKPEILFAGSFRDYADYMETEEFKKGIERLLWTYPFENEPP